MIKYDSLRFVAFKAQNTYTWTSDGKYEHFLVKQLAFGPDFMFKAYAHIKVVVAEAVVNLITSGVRTRCRELGFAPH